MLCWVDTVLVPSPLSRTLIWVVPDLGESCDAAPPGPVRWAFAPTVFPGLAFRPDGTLPCAFVPESGALVLELGPVSAAAAVPAAMKLAANAPAMTNPLRLVAYRAR